ncbi:hypothetical protein BH11MYX1_BH11MYX1_34860 [soil metagenome]
MDLEVLEALAFSNDRPRVLAQLLPGSEDHDYFTCLRAQHQGAFAEAQGIIDAWPERHSQDAKLRRLELRQLMYRVMQDPDSAADALRDRLGVSHDHEAEVAEVDPTRPTRLAPGAFDPNELLRRASDYSSDLSQVTDEGLYELLSHTLDSTRRNRLLARLHHTPAPELATLVAADLEVRGNQFGTLQIHHELTLTQLREVAERHEELLTVRAWIEAVIRRMRPPNDLDLALDRTAREAYLVEIWHFVATLPPASDNLKGHVLWHLLDAWRRRDAPVDPALFEQFLQLPRQARWVAQHDHDSTGTFVQAEDFSRVTGLWLAGDDEELVRDLLLRSLPDANRYAPWLDRSWFEGEIAEATLTAGIGDREAATRRLDPARAAALRDRIELVWCLHNPTSFGSTEPVVLEVDVKNVPELVVKVFRVDPLAYFQHQRKEVGTDLDLDGLAASHELVMRYTEPPVRKVRRRIELPMCAPAGTYVVDLIGNGISSRAVIHKGRLRHVGRTGAAGTVIAVLDEAGALLPGARAWIGEREYIADADGTFVVPFSTNPGVVPMLLMHGDLAQVESRSLAAESYALALELVLDRQQLVAGRSTQAIARVRLSCAGVPVSLALLERSTWDITITDRHDIASTKSQPLVLADDRAAVLELPLGDDLAQLSVAVRGRVKIMSTQSEQELVQTASVEVAQMANSYATEALYLARTPTGWILSALGKSGEPRAQRPVSVVLVHRWARTEVTSELATDARGRIELGELPGVRQIRATLGSSSQTWRCDDPERSEPDLVTLHGRDVVIGLPPSRTSQDLVRRLSLVELRAHVPLRHVAAVVTEIEGGLVISRLPVGEYQVRGAGLAATRITVIEPLALAQGAAVTAGQVIGVSREAPAIRALAVTNALTISLLRPTPKTRVHVIACRFVPTEIGELARDQHPVGFRTDRERGVGYISGRELGDEYRYVLDRRTAKKFPSLLLEKPSLLLNPWARRTTTTNVATARGGAGFGAVASMRARAAERAAAPGSPMVAVSDATTEAYAGYDFLAEAPIVIANLVASQDGIVTVPLADLGRATAVTVIIDDPAGSSSRRVWLAESPLEPRDLRLRVALDPDRHALQKKTIAPLRTGEVLKIADLATAKLHLLDSVEKAHAYLLALGQDATLRDFGWITRWHAMTATEQREHYSKFACHELHLFLYFKDRPFFTGVVKPYLAYKRTKTFVDHWLLGDRLQDYLEPRALQRLNAVELALLARRMVSEPALARILADRVAIIAPDPTSETRLVDTLLGASALEGESELAAMQSAAFDDAEESAPMMTSPAAAPAPMAGGPPGGAMPKKTPPESRRDEARASVMRETGDDFTSADLARRGLEAPMYRAADKTQEWAEHDWWHRTPAESNAEMIEPNKLWRDYASSTTELVLSPWFGLATGSFAEAMCALAVIDLPFVATPHAMIAEGPSLTLTASGNALAGSSQLVDAPLVPGGAPLVVGQSYVRADDRYRYEEGEQHDKYVTGPFAAGIVYTSLIVLANPTSSRQRIAALVQIPRGSIAVAGTRATQTIEIALDPYGTHGHEYSFYFPAPGTYAHFPVHVSRADQIVAAAPVPLIEVTESGAAADPHSWAAISQHGSVEAVASFLERENLAAIETSKLLWRLRERAAYVMILGALERRHVYVADAWAYALLHRDSPRIRAWLRTQDLEEAGPVQDMIGSDGEQVGTYEHLELSPLTNARAHRLGPVLRLLDDGLATQYRAFLELVAHRRQPTNEDLLAATSYLAAQDRAEATLEMLARVEPKSVTEKIQHAYLAAYAACLSGEPARARELVEPWREHAVDRWRTRFVALANMLDEIAGGATQVADPNQREQQQNELASRQPTFELALDREGAVIQQQFVEMIELRYFEMDIELLFSRQPFVQGDVSRFSFIEPGHRETITRPAAEQRVPWPGELRGKNIVVEAIGAGLRKAKIHYANELATTVAQQYGRVRVQRTNGGALPATYIKVYARDHHGSVAFYKDGYTDLRGWFDYATLSTDDLDRVDRFAILVASETAGSAILEASPPPR